MVFDYGNAGWPLDHDIHFFRINCHIGFLQHHLVYVGSYLSLNVLDLGVINI